MKADVLRIEVLHHVEQIPHGGTDRPGARAGVIHQRRAVLLVQLHEPLDLQLDGIELRHDRFRQIVVVRTEPIVSGAELAHRADQGLDRRGHVGLIAAPDLLHPQAMLLHGLHEGR